jgi:hypothetical protein
MELWTLLLVGKPGEIELETHTLRESSRCREYRTMSRKLD